MNHMVAPCRSLSPAWSGATVPSNASVVVEPSDDPQPEAVEDGPAVIDEEAAPRRAAPVEEV